MTDQSPRDKARTLLLNGYTRRTEIVEVVGGASIEIRQPTVGQRNRMLKQGGMDSEGEIRDIGKLQLAAVIECCFCPESGEQLFDWTDEAVISGLPTSSWFDLVAGKAMAIMSSEPAAAGKPLPETPNA